MHLRYSIPTLLLATFLLVTGCDQDSLLTDTGPNAQAQEPADAVLGKTGGAVVPGQYIVVLNEAVRDVPGTAGRLAGQARGRLEAVYEHALAGFSVRGVSPAAAAALSRNPNVAYVEEDRTVEIFAQQVPTGVRRIFADDNASLGIDGTDDTRVDVDVAIIDTGIDFEHPDLNVVGGVDCSGGGPFRARCKSGGDDDHYHGTHVAGSIAALDNGFGVVGVAPGARLHSVKVLDRQGSGFTSWIVAGIDWVAKNASTIEVANMSLGGSGFSQAEYDAIQGAVKKGVAFAVAAGNADDDASNYSPAAFDNVLTVSALADFDGAAGGLASATCRNDRDDTLANFSNWGDAVQIAAPGVCIRSTIPIERGEYGRISGTSMASPHAAGALALLASSSNPRNAADVQNLYSRVISNGNFNWTDDSGDGVKEPLLDVGNAAVFAPVLVAGGEGGGGGGGDEEPPSEPSGDFALSVTAYKVKGLQKADLKWNGASTRVDVYRDGALVTTTANDGLHTDAIDERGGGSYAYTVCEAGSATCSNESVAAF